MWANLWACGQKRGQILAEKNPWEAQLLEPIFNVLPLDIRWSEFGSLKLGNVSRAV